MMKLLSHSSAFGLRDYRRSFPFHSKHKMQTRWMATTFSIFEYTILSITHRIVQYSARLLWLQRVELAFFLSFILFAFYSDTQKQLNVSILPAPQRREALLQGMWYKNKIHSNTVCTNFISTFFRFPISRLFCTMGKMQLLIGRQRYLWLLPK